MIDLQHLWPNAWRFRFVFRLTWRFVFRVFFQPRTHCQHQHTEHPGFILTRRMSKRKLATSYSSLRRQVRAQVHDDMHFIAHDSMSSDSGDESADACSHADAPCCMDNGECIEPNDIASESDENDVDVSHSASNVMSDAHLQHGDFADYCWVDSSTDVDTDDDGENVVDKVNEWANKYGIAHVAITELLHILKPYLSTLPHCSRTLLHTPRSCNVKPLKCGGEYCHLGLVKGLQDMCINGAAAQTRCLELQFNVDGIPLFKSSNTSLWPILCMLKNADSSDPFVVGIYSGSEKPADASEFLSEFVDEVHNLSQNGVSIGGELYTIKIHSFVCDAPARAFLKGIKSHSGYAACEKCTEHGEYLGKVIYPGTNAPLRTNVAFDEMADEDHHLEPCPLKPLSVGYVTEFGLDYMHLVCLGVVRRLLLYWKGPVGPLSVRLGSRAVKDLSQKLVALCPHIPSDFSRKPRSVVEVLRWKATEFRQFLLYTGPVILREILSKSLYDHFLLLSVAIRILACPHLAMTFCDYANELLCLFVSEAGKLYGREVYVYNVHCLIHLAGDVKNLGTLDNFSAFPFENKLGQLKKMIRKPQFPIQQIVYRLAERDQVKSRNSEQANAPPTVKHEHSSGPMLAQYRSCRQYRLLETKKYVISLAVGNNCILATDGCPTLVENILDDNGTVVLICRYFVRAENAFSYPLPSSKLGIYKVVDKMTELFALPLSSVAQKCVLLPEKDGFVVLPLLHNISVV